MRKLIALTMERCANKEATADELLLILHGATHHWTIKNHRHQETPYWKTKCGIQIHEDGFLGENRDGGGYRELTQCLSWFTAHKLFQLCEVLRELERT